MSAYRVPSMAEIAAIPLTGLRAVSTFSGCGGSSLGYRMAGIKVLWANEFIKPAAESYAANFPDTILDRRDIRTVQPEDILTACGLAKGELDLLDGSPPCVAFSVAGQKRKGPKAQVHSNYSDNVGQRVDDLFFEYIRLLNGLQPRVFIAENVPGLAIGKGRGYLLEILRDMRGCGYKVEAKIIDCSWLGVPQARRRLFFCGVREDQQAEPTFPKPGKQRWVLQDALEATEDREGYRPPPGTRVALAWANLRIGESDTKYLQLKKCDPKKPCPVICASASGNSGTPPMHYSECRKFSVGELKAIHGFPQDFQLIGSRSENSERICRAVPPLAMAVIAGHIRDEILWADRPS